MNFLNFKIFLPINFILHFHFIHCCNFRVQFNLSFDFIVLILVFNWLHIPLLIQKALHFSLFVSVTIHNSHNAKRLLEVIGDYLVLGHNKYDSRRTHKNHIQVNAQSHHFYHKYNKVNHLDLHIILCNEYLKLQSSFHST